MAKHKFWLKLKANDKDAGVRCGTCGQTVLYVNGSISSEKIKEERRRNDVNRASARGSGEATEGQAWITMSEMKNVLALIDAEIAHLHHARALLAAGGEGIPSLIRRGPGRPRENATAVKRRWAAQKKAAAK